MFLLIPQWIIDESWWKKEAYKKQKVGMFDYRGLLTSAEVQHVLSEVPFSSP